jgi:hypothetical protein
VRHAGVDDQRELSDDIELELLVRSIPDAHGPSALVTGQPRQLDFRQAPLAADAVHDLDLPGSAADGVEDPVEEALGFILGSAAEQREERERRVAQPAEAVVPVALAARCFREPESRGGDDGTRRVVHTGFQREK